MKKVLLAFTLLIIVVGVIFFTQNYLKGGKTLSLFKKTPIITINGQNFNVTVAASQQEKEVGLSETTKLQQNQGMIFLFEKPDYYPFWMRNMKFPIDIIYIDNDTIVTIKNDVQPPKNDKEKPIIYIPTKPSDKVLEIQAGLSEKYNIRNGDKVKYENLGN